MFDIVNTLSFNKDRLTVGHEYDYVTRTSLNQGILQGTGFVNKTNLNEENVWSLGLLQMDFFYRKRKWYAGQFVRKIIPKFDTTANNIKFFSTMLNKLKPVLLQVLIRNVDDTFKNQLLNLPTKNGKIDFDFMETFVAELEAQRVAELKNYLEVSGLDDYELSNRELEVIESYDSVEWGEYRIGDLFEIKPTKSYKVTNTDLFDENGHIPVVTNSSANNGITGYTNKPFTEEGNIITYSDTTTADSIFYQPNKFVGYSHIQGLYPINYHNSWNKNSLLFFVSAFRSISRGKFSYGNKFNRKIASEMNATLPLKNGKIDFEFMETYTSAITKLAIKDVVEYADKRIAITKKIVNEQ